MENIWILKQVQNDMSLDHNSNLHYCAGAS